MVEELNNSKEVIRNRMIRYALNYWNIKNAEDLDPIVKLMLEALSNELYNLGNDIKDTQVRLLEKVSDLLAPEFLTCPQPAHALMHAKPIEAEEWISEYTQFYTQKRMANKQDEPGEKNMDLFFTPVQKVKLFGAGVQLQACGNTLSSYDAYLNKMILFSSSGKIENNTIWIGLQLDENIQNLHGLCFHFDWKNLPLETMNLNYGLLGQTRWLCNEHALSINEGFPLRDSLIGSSSGDAYLNDDLLTIVENDILQYYHQKFISIADPISGIHVSAITNYPSAFENIFPAQELKKLQTPLLWIKIMFPAAIKSDSLNDLSIHCNVFPVANRQLIDLKYRLRTGSNIIPLKTNGVEQFLAVSSVSDETHEFKNTPYRNFDEDESGSFSIRKGGVERFDNRNAREFINYLLQLLRSESSAFAAYGNDFITSTLREMDQRIALMEQKTKLVANSDSGLPHYIIAKPYEGNHLIYAKYWITLAEIGNGIRAGSRMQEYNSNQTRSESTLLVSTTIGGKNQLPQEKRIAAFRYGMMTRNRIVTKEDIRNFCYFELSDKIDKIGIDKGFEMPAESNKGFQRTLDIKITPKANETLNDEEWSLLFDRLKKKLSSRSGMNCHYRIFLKR